MDRWPKRKKLFLLISVTVNLLLLFVLKYAGLFWDTLLVPSYRRIVMVDPRYYRGSVAEVCKEYGAQELLFCYCLERLMTDANLQIIK